MDVFENRIDAGNQLAEKLIKYKDKKDTIILGIPRGGVEVAFVISQKLNLPLSVIIIKKIGAPNNPEFAIGAVSTKTFHLNNQLTKEFNIGKEFLNKEINLKQKEAKERQDFLLGDKKLSSLKNKNVILVDDGIATGETINLAINIIKKEMPSKIIVAVPVADINILPQINADEIICILKPNYLGSISEFYQEFLPVEDSEVKTLLTLDEEAIDDKTSELRFDIEFLARRLIGITNWLKLNYNYLKIGYFGASTGAAAALIASSQNKVPFAIVSRGGRPDLALNFLKNVVSPTLLIVGGNDFEVIEMNKKAFAKLKTKKKLEIVSGASHLFEEEGALEKVSSLAINWFKGNLK